MFHPLNTAYTEEELEYFLANAEPAAVVCDPSSETLFEGLCERTCGARLFTLAADGSGSLTATAQDMSREFSNVQTRGQDMAALPYSSGTTGRPKGIMLSHENLIDNAQVLKEYWGFTADDCLLHALPVFHVHGLFVAIGCVLMSGASMRWLPKFDLAKELQSLPHSTVMMGVPTYYTRLLAEPSFDADVAANIRLFVSGSAPLLSETFTEFEQRTGKTILERYGMTETGMNTSNPLDGERRAGTVGFPLPGVSVRVVGEAVTAVVVLEPGASVAGEDVVNHVKAHAANFKVPKGVHFVDSLPRNGMGKVQKNVLRDNYS